MSSIVEEAVLSVSGIGSSMESYPLCRYVKDALMLQMTGFQEQKLKCIMWEMATDDYDFRYHYILQQNLGECSNYTDKQNIFKHLIYQIRKKEPDYELPDAIRHDVVKRIKDVMSTAFEGTILKAGSDREFKEYQDVEKGITKNSFAVKDQLFCGKVGGVEARIFYKDYLYNHRNKLAHNTASYQENTPEFSVLANTNGKLRNYFLFYGYLMMIDEVFVEVFKKYLSVA